MTAGQQNSKTRLLTASFTGQDHAEASVSGKTLWRYLNLYAAYSGRLVGAVKLLILGAYLS
jgi:hypothetical protein